MGADENKSEPKPDCFGVINIVFPMHDDGLRHSPERCMVCLHKTECLRTAIKNPDGLQVQEEIVDRAYESRNISFLQRWSKRKYISKMKKEN
ncbi:MAG: hypothetical protein PF482_13780 [Desulfobacteraceae bacterium]|jgi:hypothetical protein|nr:hypothetical protein [Desulfobacteraceae bacterium]